MPARAPQREVAALEDFAATVRVPAQVRPPAVRGRQDRARGGRRLRIGPATEEISSSPCPISTGGDETRPVSTGGGDETRPVSTAGDETRPISTGGEGRDASG